MSSKPVLWAYGVTTVPERFTTTLPRTLTSLKNAGFDEPRLFIDGYDRDPGLHLPFTTRHDRIRVVGNWVLALWELYIRDPRATRYAIFQDDLITYRNLRQYLERLHYPDHGYCNLYTFPENQKLASGRTGWYPSNQLGKGAVALIFSKETVKALLTSESLFYKPQAVRNKGHKSIDGAIVTALNKTGIKEYVHNPSLVQHTGIESSHGNGSQPLAQSFLGEEYDALALLDGSPEVHAWHPPAKVPRSVSHTPRPVPQARVPTNPTKEREVKYSPRRPRIGLVGRNCGTSDSALNYQLAYMLVVDAWLVENDPKLPLHPAPTGMLYTVYRGEAQRAKKFLSTLDIVVFVDVPLYPVIIDMAIEAGKRVVCIDTPDLNSGMPKEVTFVGLDQVEGEVDRDPRAVIEGIDNAADSSGHGGQAEAGRPASVESPAVPTEPRVEEGDRAGGGVDEEAHDGRRLADLRRSGVVGVSPLRPSTAGQRDERPEDLRAD